MASIPPFETFYAEHARRGARPAAPPLGRERADDAFQETFLRALRAYDRLRARRAPPRLGADDRARVAIDTAPARRRADAASFRSCRHLDGRPAYEELAFLTDTLPPKERAAVVLRYGYDLDYDADRSRPRLEPRRGPPGGVVGCPAAAKESTT